MVELGRLPSRPARNRTFCRRSGWQGRVSPSSASLCISPHPIWLGACLPNLFAQASASRGFLDDYVLDERSPALGAENLDGCWPRLDGLNANVGGLWSSHVCHSDFEHPVQIAGSDAGRIATLRKGDAA